MTTRTNGHRTLWERIVGAQEPNPLADCPHCDALSAVHDELGRRVAEAIRILETFGDCGGMPALRVLRGQEACPEPVPRRVQP